MARVCFFCGDISRTGGTERVTTVIASELARTGHEVSILSGSHGRSTVFELSPEVTLHSLDMQRHSANLSDWRIWYRLRRFIREQQIDLLVDVDVILSWYSIPAAWGTRTRVIAWEHFHLFVNTGDCWQRCRRWLGRWLAVRYAQALITLTERDRRQYLDNLRCRTRVLAIPNPQTIAHVQRAALDRHVVLAAGRLVAQKGFDLLLHAWHQVANAGLSGWRLRIVGSGPDEALLRRLAGQLELTASVEFVPNTTDMAGQFLGASVFALSSRFEGFALVLLEARSFGLPVVSFDCACGPSDILTDGEDGLLVAPGDVAGFAAALRRLIDDEALRRTLGRRAAEDQRFARDAVIGHWRALIDGN